MTYVAPSEPQSIGGVLDSWLRLFRDSFGRCWTLAALSSVTAGILIFLVTPVLPAQAMGAWQQRLQQWAMLNGPQGALAPVLVMLIELVVAGALFAMQVAVMQGRFLTFGEALTWGLRRFPRMLWGFVLVMLAIVGVGMAVGIPVALVAGVTAGLTHYSGAGIAGHFFALAVVFITAIAAVIVIAYVTVRLAIWQPAIFIEDDSATASIGRSWRLVKGHWWRTSVILFVADIVMMVLGFAVPWLVGLALGVFSAQGTALSAALFTVRLIQVFAQATRIITLPLGTALWLAIYHDLKLRREGTDLAARAEALSGA